MVVEGITFVPDKEMLGLLRSEKRLMVKVKGSYEQQVSRAELLKKLAAYCEANGSFTQRAGVRAIPQILS